MSSNRYSLRKREKVAGYGLVPPKRRDFQQRRRRRATIESKETNIDAKFKYILKRLGILSTAKISMRSSCNQRSGQQPQSTKIKSNAAKIKEKTDYATTERESYTSDRGNMAVGENMVHERADVLHKQKTNYRTGNMGKHLPGSNNTVDKKTECAGNCHINKDEIFRIPLPKRSPALKNHALKTYDGAQSQGLRTFCQSPYLTTSNESNLAKPPQSPYIGSVNLPGIMNSPVPSLLFSTSELPCLTLTPNLGLGAPCHRLKDSPQQTPGIFSQWESPCVPAEALSTPFLMKTDEDCPDLISMLDDETGSVQALDHSLNLYDHIYRDELDSTTDCTNTLRSNYPERKLKHAQGRYGKRMTEEMLKGVKDEQKRRSEARKKIKQENNTSSNLCSVMERISKGGRRTRSILRLCDELDIKPSLKEEREEE